jgi:hypothetical protein
MRRLLAVAALAALLLGGCGIPDETRVTVVGPGPSGPPGARGELVQSVPNTRETANSTAQLLEFYLAAAAGDPNHAADRVRAFLMGDAKSSFDAARPSEIRVIRIKGKPLWHESNQTYTFSAQTFGTLKSDGSLEPTSDPKSDYTVGIGSQPGKGYFVSSSSAKRALLLSDTALDQFYQPRTIYFWNNDNTELLPDLRYMPTSVPSAQQPTTIVNWLVKQPAGWLSDVARILPTGTQVTENVPADTNNTLIVTLTGQAAPAGDVQALDRLRRQLQASLLSDSEPQTLELKIKGQDPVRYSSRDYLASIAADRLVETPQRFAVLGGVIRRIPKPPQTGDDPIPGLRPEDNKGIATAAMSSPSAHTYVAVVTTGKTSKLRVGFAENGKQATLHDVAGLHGTLGRPVWAVTANSDPQSAVGLITVNGKLYSFTPGGSAASLVQWQDEPGAITAVSVAPDGYRVAIAAGGKLYRATLDTSGDTVALSSPERLFPPIFDQVTAVAWSSETYLAVAGLREDGQRYAVADVSVDGALGSVRAPDAGGEAVTYLTAYPANPTSHGESADIESYESAGSAWNVSSSPVKIQTRELFGAPANPPTGLTPTAPFFLF